LNRVTNYTNDTMGRPTTVTYPDSSTVTFAYDANGNRTSTTESTGTTTWAYNALNLVTSETKGTDSISYGYDAGGRKTSQTDQAGVTVTYGYDGMNRLTSASRGPTWNASYSYDSNSNLVSQTNPNGTTVTLGHNSADWLTSVVNKKSDGTTLSSFTYAYNTDGLRSSVTEADGSQVTYGYDALHRLTSEVRTGTSPYNISYGYDPAGNRLNKVLNGVGTSYTYDDANRLLSAGGTTYSWNANGNLLSKTEGGVTTNFSYNFDDQLVSISGPTSVSFAYDGVGRRVSRTASGATTTFLFDNRLITTEKQGAALVAHYTFGRDRVSRDDGTNFLYYLVDGLGSTRQLTDANEAVAASYLFEGFGILLAQSGSAANAYKFAGAWSYRDDGDAGLLHVGARYYDAQVGRFITADTLLGTVYDPQTLNRYIYVVNSPITLVDPSGLLPIWLLLLLLVVLLIAAAELLRSVRPNIPPINPALTPRPGPPE
jgi:RHS repeat-associated protein